MSPAEAKAQQQPLKAVIEAYDGITVEAFAAAVREFFDTARHPVLGVPYTKIAFRPMRELITLLEAGAFEVYICSAGGRDFVRVVAQEIDGIPPQRVIGSGTTLEYRDGAVYRTRGVEQRPDESPGKPILPGTLRQATTCDGEVRRDFRPYGGAYMSENLAKGSENVLQGASKCSGPSPAESSTSYSSSLLALCRSGRGIG